jgi:broad specificity phosphatase PhoE
MKEVWLIRHAESIVNIGGKTVTPDTIELSQSGIKQAEDISDVITNQPDLIITSPFIRTLQTARPLLRKFPDSKHEQWPVQEFTYLSPIRCKNTTMEERIPWAIEYWERCDPYYCDRDGAESFSDFIKRVIDIKGRLSNRPDKFIVVFSHYLFIAAYNWLDSINGQSVMTSELMADFRKYLLSHNLQNAGINKIFVRNTHP